MTCLRGRLCNSYRLHCRYFAFDEPSIPGEHDDLMFEKMFNMMGLMGFMTMDKLD